MNNLCSASKGKPRRRGSVAPAIQSELPESRHLFRELFDNTFQLLWLLDHQGKLVEINQSALDLNGTTKETVIGALFCEASWWSHDRTLQRRLREAVDCCAGGDALRCEAECRDTHGRIRHLELSLKPLRDDQGRIAWLIGEGHDLTARKVAEEELRKSEELFQQLFAQNSDAILLIGQENHAIIAANLEAENLFGLRREDFTLLSPPDLVAPDDFRRLLDILPLGAPPFSSRLEKATALKKDGTTTTVSIHARVLQLRQGGVIFCSFRDITEEHRLDQEIKSIQAKLIQTNKMTSLGMLASSITHEINNPNHCIAINNSVLSNIWRDAQPILQAVRAETCDFSLGGLPIQELEQVAPRLFNGIAESSKRIMEIVNSMKDFVKQPGSSPRQETFAVHEAINKSTAMLLHNIRKHTASYHLELADNLPLVHGSSQQIEQVMINLIMNALQSLPDKACGVSVRSTFDAASSFVTITIKDQGKGMRKNVLSSLGEPFFTTRGAEGGTGLGIYISSAIIKEHGGSLQFDSTPNEGTTVTLRLPAA